MKVGKPLTYLGPEILRCVVRLHVRRDVDADYLKGIADDVSFSFNR